MAKFILAMECDNAAFIDAVPNGVYTEVTVVLAGLIRDIMGRPVPDKGTDKGVLWDTNGNKVGEWLFRA